MLAQMRREFVEYADVRDVDRQLASVQQIASSFLTTAIELRGLVLEERRVFALVGAEAAQNGISLRSLLAGVRLAMRVAWLYAAEEARELGPPALAISALEEVGLSLLNFVDELTAAISEGYAQHARGPESAGARR